MSKKYFEYNGYIGSIESCLETLKMYGKIEFINDLVTFGADSLTDLKKEFESAVDDYLLICEDLGTAPDKPFSGTFNIRVGKDLHKKIAHSAATNDSNINSWVKEACLEKLDENNTSVINHINIVMGEKVSSKSSMTIDYSEPSSFTNVLPFQGQH
jgi:predicted HicB family RNase H-like nuclease